MKKFTETFVLHFQPQPPVGLTQQSEYHLAASCSETSKSEGSAVDSTGDSKNSKNKQHPLGADSSDSSCKSRKNSITALIAKFESSPGVSGGEQSPTSGGQSANYPTVRPSSRSLSPEGSRRSNSADYLSTSTTSNSAVDLKKKERVSRSGDKCRGSSGVTLKSDQKKGEVTSSDFVESDIVGESCEVPEAEKEEAVDLDLPLGAEAIGHNPGAADQDDLEEAEEAMLGVTSGTAGRWVFTT